MPNAATGLLTACFRIVIQDKTGRVISNDAIRHYLRDNELLIEQYGRAELFRTISLGTGDSDDNVLRPTVDALHSSVDVTVRNPLNNRQYVREIKTAKGTDVQFEFVETVFGLNREEPLQLTELSIDGIGRILLRDRDGLPKTYTLNFDESMTIYCDIRHSLITPDAPLSLRFWDDKEQEAIPYDVFVRYVPTTQRPTGLDGAVDSLEIQLLLDQDPNLHPNTLMNKATTPVGAVIEKQGFGYVEKRLAYQPTVETVLSGIVMYQKSVGAKFFLMLSEPIHFNPAERREFFLLYEWGGKPDTDGGGEGPIEPEIPVEPEVPVDQPRATRVYFENRFSGYATQGLYLDIISSMGESRSYEIHEQGIEFMVVSPYEGLDYVDILSEGSRITLTPHFDDTGDHGVTHLQPGALPIPIEIVRTARTMMASRMVSLPIDNVMVIQDQQIIEGDNFYLMGNGVVGSTAEGEGVVKMTYDQQISHTVPLMALPIPDFTINVKSTIIAGEIFAVTASYNDPELAEHYGDFEIELEHDSKITNLGGNQYKSDLLLSGNHDFKVLIKSDKFDTVVHDITIEFTPIVIDFPSIESMYVGETAPLKVEVPDNFDYGMTTINSSDPTKCQTQSIGNGVFRLSAIDVGEVDIELSVMAAGYKDLIDHSFKLSILPTPQPRIRMEPTIQLADGEVILEVDGIDLTKVENWWIESKNNRLAHLDGLILYPHGYGTVELFLHVETQWGIYSDNFLLEII